MKSTRTFFILAFILMACQSTPDLVRETDFNFDWKFQLTDENNAFQADFDDRTWRTLRLPHDWSVEFPFDSVNGEGATAYLPGGIGWYRKHFTSSQSEDELTLILFDGIYNNAEVWINGHKLGFHPYGYSPFYYDLTPYLHGEAEDNVIAVRVDRTRFVDSRWYTGSGIYRNVKLVRLNKLHIPIWGTYVTTPEVSKELAMVNMEVTIQNNHPDEHSFKLTTEISDPSGSIVVQKEEVLLLNGNSEEVHNILVQLTNPQLWGIESPEMYTAIHTLLVDGEIINRYETPFGIRSFRFHADLGFFLNGENMKIKGVCLHHDAGLVGAAVPIGVWERRLKILRESGCNAIRTAHNPPSEEFLDLCDRMGFLVQDEFFDEMDYPKDKRTNTWEKVVDYETRGYTEHFQEWGERDLKSIMLRDRNHPGIIQWSIGNEIEWTYPRYKHATGFFDMNWKGNYFFSPPPIPAEQIKQRFEESPQGEYVLAETAQKLAKWTKEMDRTRPVIANCILPSASYQTGYTDALDMVGFSYRRVMYDYGHALRPDQAIMGTENVVRWHEWKAVEERPFISGLFLWTGINYLGEANKDWPGKGSGSGMLDFGGFEKPSYHMMKSLWNDEPHVHISSQLAEKSIFRVDENGKVVEKRPGSWETVVWGWQQVNEHWNYSNNEEVIVEVLSNCPEVELFLNNETLGSKNLTEFEDHIYKWALPYTPGILMARGIKDGKATGYQVATHSEPVALQMDIDHPVLQANSYDVAHIIVQLVDENGNPVRSSDMEVVFEIEGPVRSLGVDNGVTYNVRMFQTDRVLTDQGRCLLIVQAESLAAEARIKAKVEGLKESEIFIKITPTLPKP